MREAGIGHLDFGKGGGLIPVVVQDFSSKAVLMLAYVDREALSETMRTGYAHYWSRSRRRLWRKGETSGQHQKVVDIIVDCDSDALLFLVDQEGAACHTGARVCFHNKLRDSALEGRGETKAK